MTAGAQRSWSGRGLVEASRGNLITVNPDEVHDGLPIGEERAWSMLYISPTLVGSIVADATEGKLAMRELPSPVIRDVRVARLFASARAAAAGDDADALDANLLVLLGTLLRIMPVPSPHVPHRLVLARERIDSDPAARHPLATLASLAGLSRFQTLRGFVRMTGLTPHAYLIQRRLHIARHLIRTGSTLADAAAAAGFADQSHCHRAFTARYGHTPGAYAVALGH